MLPIILAIAGGYLIADSIKKNDTEDLKKIKLEDGGTMAKGGKVWEKGDIVKIKNKSKGESDYTKGLNGTAKLLENEANADGMIKAIYFGEEGYEDVKAFVWENDIEKID